MKTCSKCGVTAIDEATVCSKCGAPLSVEQEKKNISDMKLSEIGDSIKDAFHSVVDFLRRNKPIFPCF